MKEEREMALQEGQKEFFEERLGQRICCERKSANAPLFMTTAHYHDFYEIYYLVYGERKYFIDDSVFLLKKGDFVLIPRDTLHRTTFTSQTKHERILVYFPGRIMDPSLLGEVFSGYKLSVPIYKTAFVEELFRKMEAEQDNTDGYSAKLMSHYLFELLVFLSRLRKNVGYVNEDKMHDAHILAAVKYINTHFDQNLTLPKMAAMFSLSDAYFSRKFKDTTGFGFSEYLNYTRILAAAKLLTSTDLSVMEVSHICGFNDSNYFTVVFKKINGTTPLVYRRTNRPLLKKNKK
jgi:AraC-like DNA-binding protein/mannose-6-phosphate isomerase-like protein (cupin superfamily)